MKQQKKTTNKTLITCLDSARLNRFNINTINIEEFKASSKQLLMYTLLIARGKGIITNSFKNFFPKKKTYFLDVPILFIQFFLLLKTSSIKCAHIIHIVIDITYQFIKNEQRSIYLLTKSSQIYVSFSCYNIMVFVSFVTFVCNLIMYYTKAIVYQF